MRPFIYSMMLAAVWLVTTMAAADQVYLITTKPGFSGPPGKYVDLVISDTNRHYRIIWGLLGGRPEQLFVPVSLDTNRVYTFTVGERPFHNAAITELRRVQLGGRVLYDVEVCEVHHIPMEFKAVPVAYGLMRPNPDDPDDATEHRLFPHAREYVPGGCIVMADWPKTERIYVCRECQQAAAGWRAELQRKKTDQRRELLNAPKPLAYKLGTLADGGTLSGVAKLFYGDAGKWRVIYEANRAVVRNPNQLTGRETLTIPKL